jgi:hypothetical protein
MRSPQVHAGLMKRALVVLVAALCGCAGGGSSGPPAGCGTIVGTQSDPIVQPANGATGVPIDVGSITVPLVNGILGGAVGLQPANGTQIPAGRLTQVGAGGTTVSVAVPVLAPHTTYAVIAQTSVPPTDAQACWQTTAWDLGSFTTQ